MKKQILLLSIFSCMILLPGNSYASELCKDDSSSYDYDVPINKSCHYECTDTAHLYVPGPQEGLAGMGVNYPFSVSVTTQCTVIHHPEEYPPEPQYPPPHLIPKTCTRRVCDTCKDEGGGGGGTPPGEKPNPGTGGPEDEFCSDHPLLCQMSSSSILPTVKYLTFTNRDYQLMPVRSCNCRDETYDCSYWVPPYAWEIAKYNEDMAAWRKEIERINAERAQCQATSPIDEENEVTDVNKVQLEITEKQKNKKLGRVYSYGTLQYVDGKFVLPYTYIEPGTGNVPLKVPDELSKYYKGGRYYYTDFLTQKSDGPHPIYVDAIKLGKNQNMTLHAECYYNLENKYYNEDPEPGEDPNNPGDTPDVGKGIQYIFRPISLDDVFPTSSMYPNGRPPRWNWSSGATNGNDIYYPINPVKLTNEIESKAYHIYDTSNNKTDSSSELEYEIRLTPDVMRKVRQYNKDKKSYLNYEDYCYLDHQRTVCKSKFLETTLPSYGAKVMSNAIVGCNNQKGNVCDYSLN